MSLQTFQMQRRHSNIFHSTPRVQDRRNNCDTKCSNCETSKRARRPLDAPRGTSRYSVYNKFRRQTCCVRYLDAPTLCVTLAAILRLSRIPDTYQRNYEICKQTRYNSTSATAGHVFQYPPTLAQNFFVTAEIEVILIRRCIYVENTAVN